MPTRGLARVTAIAGREPMPAGTPRVALIALGNPMRGDDALGLVVGERVLGRLRAHDPERSRTALAYRSGGLDALAIVDAWSDARFAVVVDAARSGRVPGTPTRVPLRSASAPPDPSRRERPRDAARASSHGLGLAEALSIGDSLQRLPEEIVCYTIEAFGFALGAPLSEAVVPVVDSTATRIADEILAAWHHRTPPTDRPPTDRTPAGIPGT